jgi:hypothetical protein
LRAILNKLPRISNPDRSAILISHKTLQGAVVRVYYREGAGATPSKCDVLFHRVFIFLLAFSIIAIYLHYD